MFKAIIYSIIGIMSMVTPGFSKENIMSSFEEVKRENTILVGIECRTQNTPDKAPIDIAALWDKFLKEDIFSQIPSKVSDEVYALYTDYEGDHTKPYSIIIGCMVSSVDNLPEHLVAKKIPGGNFAKFKAVGKHPEALITTWQNIWSDETLSRRYSGDLEVYGQKFQNDPQEVDVLIAIE